VRAFLSRWHSSDPALRVGDLPALLELPLEVSRKKALSSGQVAPLIRQSGRALKLDRQAVVSPWLKALVQSDDRTGRSTESNHNRNAPLSSKKRTVRHSSD
jgi:hypothetical protein